MFRSWKILIAAGLALALWTLGLAVAQAEVLVEPRPEIDPVESPRGVDLEALQQDPRMEPSRDPLLHQLSGAWAIPAQELRDRALRLRTAAAPLGLTNLEGPAQALLLDENAGSLLDRAQASRMLAPELPAARAAMAQALWQGRQPGKAWAELKVATRQISAHVEARSWVEMTIWNLAWLTGLCAGAGFIFLALIEALPKLTRHVGAVAEDMPGAARLATIGALLLLPAALGEGFLGVLWVACAWNLTVGQGPRRTAIAAAALLVLVSLHPVLDRAASERVALANVQPWVTTQQVERGISSPVARERVWRHADGNVTATRAMALEARRRGLLEQADALFTELTARSAEDPKNRATLASNAASTKLALGDRVGALDLLEKAVAADDSDPVLYFNLAQAYGAVVRIEDQNAALKTAQRLDADRVQSLNRAFGPSQIAERHLLRPGSTPSSERLSGAAAAAALRRQVAPGRLGESPLAAATGLGAAAFLGLLLGWAFAKSGRDEGDLRTRIKKLVENRSGDSSDRIQRLAELRARESALVRLERFGQVLLPGFAGLRADQPLLGGLAFGVAALMGCLLTVGAGPVPAPLSLGVWPALMLPWVLIPALLAYVGLTGSAIWLRGRS